MSNYWFNSWLVSSSYVVGLNTWKCLGVSTGLAFVCDVIRIFIESIT